MKELLLAYYGDDFTGSTDALEFITRAGAKAILFTEPPTAEALQAFPDLDAYGVAGKTRALSPHEMEQVLMPSFEQMKTLGAKHVHYKVCSTFDSSPMIGSIGRAIDCGAAVFKNKVIPVLGGMPALGRFCAFGNLFAKMGIGSEGKIYRLDRHPSMSKHPSTPMDESDLRIHLAKQTDIAIGLIDITQLKKDIAEWDYNEDIVLIDALSEAHLEKIGEWLCYLQKEAEAPLFSVGSSGIEMALGKYWSATGLLKPGNELDKVEPAVPLLVVSGSCSPVTKKQIQYSVAQGFEEVVIDAVAVCSETGVDATIQKSVVQLLEQNKNVIVHTGVVQTHNLPSEKLGTVLGTIAKNAVLNSHVKRVIVAGGDTSSYAARAMEIDGVEMIASLVKGAPLCKAYSKNEKINNLEVNFKGGQVGANDYFERMAKGDCS